MDERGHPRAGHACVDLYLGGDLGLWALHEVDSASIRTVFTLDEQIVEAAESRGISQGPESPDPGDVAPGSIAVCVHYPKIFPADLIKQYDDMYNLHPGYLPWGRGFYPVFWALLKNEPAGATLHEIAEELDKGPIVMQVRVPYGPEDTGGSLHQRVREAERQIFRQLWPRLIAGERLPRRSSTGERGSYHSRADFVALRDAADVSTMSGTELLHLIRCLTFDGLPGMRVNLGQKTFEVRLVDSRHSW